MVYTNYSGFPFYSVYHTFNRDFQEVKGWTYRIDEEKGFADVFINALGVSKDDIDVTWRNGDTQDSVIFTVKGETKIDERLKVYDVNLSFVSPYPVKRLTKKFANGLVILHLEFSKPSQPEIEVVEE